MHNAHVLIVGGGAVGLSLACELGWRGVSCILIEQTNGRIDLPRTTEISIRTMEHCRRWGIAKEVRDASFPADFPLDIAYVTTLSGYELARIPRPSRARQEPGPYSPECTQICPQNWFDPILRRFAQSLPSVELRYCTRLESFQQDENGVIADVTDIASGRRHKIAACYLVGCDGASSGVRRALGIEFGGRGALSHAINLFFRASHLLEKCGREPGLFFHAVDRGGLWANIRAIDAEKSVWRLMVNNTGVRQSPDEVDRKALLRRAIGRDIDVEWLGATTWTRCSTVADHYSEGRVFLAGDAVHQFSPTGGQGANTGIGDAVDLGWKLAAVIEGWGGPHLLASYEQERRPIGLRNVEHTTRYFLDHFKFNGGMEIIEHHDLAGARMRAQLGEALLREVGRTFHTTGLELGYCYEGSPICVPDGTLPEPDDPGEYVPSTRPGARAPHFRLHDGRSSLDLYGRGFVLLRFGEGAPDFSSFEPVTARRGVPLRTIAITKSEAAEGYGATIVLIRPDGHVAWRANKLPNSIAEIIDSVRGSAILNSLNSAPELNTFWIESGA